MFLVSRKGTRAGSACGRDEYSPGEKRKQEDKPAGIHDTCRCIDRVSGLVYKPNHSLVVVLSKEAFWLPVHFYISFLTVSSHYELKSRQIHNEMSLY